MIVNNKTESRRKNPGNNNNNNIAKSEVKKTSINQLNLKCLANIFSHIPPEDRLDIKNVCKKWKEAVALSWYSVKKFDAKNISVPINQILIIISQLLQKFCQYLTHLTIDFECFWMTGILKNNCKNIIYFDVGIEDPDFTENLCGIIGSMKKLKYLKVQTHDERSCHALRNKLSEILPADIEDIHFLRYKTNPYKCETSGTAPALDKFKNLRCLTLNYFYLETPTIESILLNKNSLVYLDLTGCCLPVECPITLFKQLVNLEHLNLAVKNLTEYMIDEIIRNCQKLKYLGVNRFYRYYIQSSTFYKLKYLTNLEHLDFPPVSKLNYIDDNIMSDVFYNCKKLKYLNVGRGRSFSTLDFEAITKLTNLQYLNLYVAGVDSHSFINIASNCLELKELNIILYDLSEIALEKLTNLKKLEKLDLGYCANLTGDILSKIAINCKNLVDLDLYGCNYLTEDSLIQVGKLDNLKKLDISGIENVPIEMFDYFRKLEKLNCEYCPSVTDEAIKKVIDNCFNLSLLNLMQTGITVDTLVHAAKRKFPLKILNIFVNESVEDDYFSLNELKQKSYIIFNYETESRGKNPVNNNNNNNNIAKSEVKKTSINQLNLKCLANIFSHIPPEDRLEIKKVCKKWEEAVDMSWYNVKKFDAENISVPINEKGKILKQLLNKFCQYLTHLTIDYECSWMTGILKNNCKNIVPFDVTIKQPEYTKNLCKIIDSMKKLRYLKVRRKSTTQKYPDLWNKLSKILPAEIEEIHFSLTMSTLLYGLSEIHSELNKFKNLRCLTLEYFSLTTATIESILLNKNSLIYLDLHGCHLPEECPITLFAQLVNLEHLNLGEQFGNINENMIITIAHNCQKLKYLCIGNGCYSKTSLSRSTFNELKYLNNLEHLDFPRVVRSDRNDDNLIADVFDNCKQLKYLNVGNGDNFSTLHFEAITKLNNLQYLNLDLADVDSQSFINIANNCLELKEFNVYPKDISEIAFEKLTNLKKLEKLNFAFYENLTGNLLSKIVNNCKNLVDLNLCKCCNLTEDSLIQVGKLDNLKKLNISGIKNVPNSMFFNYRKLEELHCGYCPSVSDEGIIKVIDNCRKLSKLNLMQTGITVDTLVHAAKRKFPLKILNILVNESVEDDYFSVNELKQKSYIIVNYETESRGKNPVNNNNNNNIAKFEVKKTSINQLNLECLANIFSHIPPEDRLEIKKVCKKWEEAVALSWYSVKKFDAKNISVPIKKKGKILKQLLNKFCQHLTHLTIDYQYSWRTDILKNNCKNIVYFDVFIKCSDEYLYSHHDTESLCEIIGSMKKLKYLKVHTRHEYPDLWNKLSEILPAEIEEIHFSKINWNLYSRELSEIDSVLDKFKNLRRLTLQYFSLTTAIINLILLNKNSLIYLDLSGCNLQEACPIILFTQLVNLEHLNLGEQFGNINENMIITIAHNCQKLKYLCIGNGCYSKTSLSRSTFNELKYLNNLEHLDFSCVVKSDDDDDDDNLIRDVFNNCKKLKYMNVGRGENFSRLDIQAIAKLINLEYLDISLAKVDSQSFINIANNCLELKKLMIDLVDISEIALEKLTNLKKLEKLNLARCDNLTGNLLSKIVDNCKNLVDLDVAMCKNVTEDSLMQVVKLDNLKKLDVGWIENVPISMFFNFCKLEILVCYNCPTITDEVIIKVIDNCLKLSKLYLKKTGITVDTLVHAKQRKFPYKILKIQVNRFLHDEYLKLNRKPSHYLKIDYV